MNPALQRFADWCLEQRIRELADRITDCTLDDRQLAHDLWVEMAVAIGQRSPAQVLRMERARGLR